VKAVLAVLVGLAVLAAGFGIYRWQGGGDAERARAEKAAEDWAAYCRRQGGTCEVVRLERMDEGVWRFHVRAPNGGVYCRSVELEHFLFSELGEEGIQDTPCRSDQMTTEEVQRRLTASEWAREHTASLISCLGHDRGVGLTSFFSRFRCRYSSPRGDGLVVLATTGPDTFEIVSSE
jgi:hypothetical protein